MLKLFLNTLKKWRRTPRPLTSSTRPLFSCRAPHRGAHRHPKIMTKAHPKPNRSLALWQLPTDIRYWLNLSSPRGVFGMQIDHFPSHIYMLATSPMNLWFFRMSLAFYKFLIVANTAFKNDEHLIGQLVHPLFKFVFIRPKRSGKKVSNASSNQLLEPP